MEYIIIGYYPELDSWCLVCLAGTEEEHALEVLKRMITEPDENDKKLIRNATVLSIDTVSKKDAWWNDPFLMSD